MDFKQLGLTNDLLEAVRAMGFTEPTPIQREAIPYVLDGRDVIGQAQTGTGKTAAFGIPMVEKVDPNANQWPQGLVITPTRELAVQVSAELNGIGKFKGIRAVAVYGGESIDKQIRSFKRRPHIITATPGRLLDHLERGGLHLDAVRIVVLDEADEMLNMGFIDDIKTILSRVPQSRQTLLFSATMPDAIRKLAERFMTAPAEVKIKAKTLTVDKIDQHFIELKEWQKLDVFTRLLDIQQPERAIVFGRTKRRVDELATALRKLGYPAKGLHGDLTQNRRDQVMDDFKNHRVKILVATDVAARGLDIEDVTHVYNFDLPQDPESYVHRIGRTGRAGKRGEAVTFVTPPERPHLYTIEKAIKRKIARMAIPTREEASEARRQRAVEALVAKANGPVEAHYHQLAEDLLHRHDPVQLVSAALKMITHEPDIRPIRLTEEKPLQVKQNIPKRRSAGRRSHAVRGKADERRRTRREKAWNRK
jgi:ATP-dependent RNA helicase DeaD